MYLNESVSLKNKRIKRMTNYFKTSFGDNPLHTINQLFYTEQ